VTAIHLLPASGQFVWFLQSLIDIIFRRAFMQGPQNMRIHRRVAGLFRRFRWLVAHVQAGTLPPVRKRAPGAEPRVRSAPAPGVSAPGAADTPVPKQPGERRLDGFGWLAKLWPPHPGYANEFYGIGGGLVRLLEEPELAALIAQAPERFGRVLRPLLRALAQPIPPSLRLPARVPDRRTVPPGEDAARQPVSSPTRASGLRAREAFTIPIPRGVPRIPRRLREKPA
jgi:hypothetical protein